MEEPYRHIDINDLEPGDHLCCIYQSEEEHRALLTPYLRQGLERGEKVLYIVDSHTAEGVLGYLEDDGLDTRPYLGSGQLSILTVGDAYMREGEFDPDGMIGLLRAEAELAVSQGYPALRVTGEMSWALRGLPGSEKLIEYEAKLNRFFPGSRCLAICQYDGRRFGPHVLLDVLTTHPIAVMGTGIYDNFYYISPDEYLGDKLPEAALEHRLANLKNRKATESALCQERDFSAGLIQGLPVFFVALNPDGKIRMINDFMLNRLGYTSGEVLGRDYVNVFATEEEREAVSRIFDTLVNVEGSVVSVNGVRAKNGRELLVEWHGRQVFGEDGNLDFFFAVGIDITERRRSEEELDRYREQLEGLVRERTRELERANMLLREEVAERRRNQEELAVLADRLRALSTYMESVREEERRHAAREVHDTLGQALTGLKINLSLLGKKLAGDGELEERIRAMSGQIDSTIQSVREIATQLRPGVLDDLGLAAALEWQVKRFGEMTGLDSTFASLADEASPDDDLAIALFRIAQEALTNVARHAGASRVDVSLAYEGDAVSLEVRDDGRGIGEEDIENRSSLGIMGMRERANAFGGEVDIRGGSGGGTTLLVRIPMRCVGGDPGGGTGEEGGA